MSEILKERIDNLEHKLDYLINIFSSLHSKYYTIDTLAKELNKSATWVYKNKHLFMDAIVIADPSKPLKLLFNKSKIHKILENNSKIFRGVA